MRKLLLFIFISTCIFSAEEIQVSLSTKKNSVPIYVSSIFKDKNEIEKSHLDNILRVLEFDLDNSGYVTLMKREKSKEILLSRSDFKTSFDPEFWKNQKTRFVIKLTSAEKKLNVFLYDTLLKEYKYFSTIYLSGDLNIDRRQIHKLSDDFFADYLGKKGVASSTILYTVRRDNPDKNGIPWLSEVWSADYDGYNKRQVTQENSYCVSPAYLPSSDKNDLNFLFVSYKRGIPKIYIMEGSNTRELISLRGNQLLPSISPRKDSVAFISDAAGRPDLFLQKLDMYQNPIGKPKQLFTAPRASQATSSFSPDGKKLAFVSDKDGSPRIYLIKIPENSNNTKRPFAYLITKKNRHNVTPSWSRDGMKLAYSAKTEGTRQIWVYDFITGDETQLTFEKENKENPCWAEDNLHIVYNTEDKDISNLYIINLNNPKPVKISSGVGQKRFPAWAR